jgi:hypothetical protein
MAQPWRSPIATSTAPEGMVSNGVSCGLLPPPLPVAMPSPQHDTLPPARSAQVESSPQATCTASVMPPAWAQVRAGTLKLPVPIWPFPLAPTHAICVLGVWGRFWAVLGGVGRFWAVLGGVGARGLGIWGSGFFRMRRLIGGGRRRAGGFGFGREGRPAWPRGARGTAAGGAARGGAGAGPVWPPPPTQNGVLVGRRRAGPGPAVPSEPRQSPSSPAPAPRVRARGPTLPSVKSTHEWRFPAHTPAAGLEEMAPRVVTRVAKLTVAEWPRPSSETVPGGGGV